VLFIALAAMSVRMEVAKRAFPPLEIGAEKKNIWKT